MLNLNILKNKEKQIQELAKKMLGVKYIDIYDRECVSENYVEYNMYFHLAEKDYVDRSRTIHSIYKKIILKGQCNYFIYCHIFFYDGYEIDINADKLYNFTKTIEAWLKQVLDEESKGEKDEF